MFKRHVSSNKKLISKSACAFALTVPFISVFGETKASNLILGQNQYFIENKQAESFQFTHQSDHNKFNLNPDSFLISEGENQKDENTLDEEQRVLISEILIEGLEEHPDKQRLEVIAYDAMLIRPGSKVTSEEVKKDLDRIYSTGWFSGAKIESLRSALGVQLLIKIEANPILNKITMLPFDRKLSNAKLNEIFNDDYGKTLNLNTLQIRIKEIKEWYNSKGYSLARISGPKRVTKEGRVELNIQEGYIAGIEINFIDEDGNTKDEKGRLIKGKTKRWVIERELITKVGDIFNRNKLESDIKRLYSTSLFNDVKVTLKPVNSKSGKIIISLGITEQRTGSLTGGLGYSGGQGVFGQIGLQESNLVGRSWSSSMNSDIVISF